MRRAGRAVRLATGALALGPRDVVLASFPRSGSTFLRALLANTLDDEGPFDFARLNAAMPELGVSRLSRRPRAVRFVKTHRPRAWWLRRAQSVWLARAPLDALASYHRYWTSRLGAEAVAPGAFLRDARRGLPAWIRHTRSWEGRADLEVRYHALCLDPARELARVLAVAGLAVEPAVLLRAVERSRPETLGSPADAGSDAFGPDFAFARDAPDSTLPFSERDLAWAEARLRRSGLGAWT